MLVMILTRLERRVEDSVRTSRDRKYKKETELRHTIAEVKNTVEGINTRLEDAEKWIRNLGNR